jgi:hypothetical protein
MFSNPKGYKNPCGMTFEKKVDSDFVFKIKAMGMTVYCQMDPKETFSFDMMISGVSDTYKQSLKANFFNFFYEEISPEYMRMAKTYCSAPDPETQVCHKYDSDSEIRFLTYNMY